MKWNEFLALKGVTNEEYLMNGFIFYNFSEAFPDIELFDDESELLITDLTLRCELSNRYVNAQIIALSDIIEKPSDVKDMCMLLLRTQYYHKWLKIYKNFIYEYTHGSNYDLTETREVKHTGDVTRVETNTGTESTVIDETVKNTGGDTIDTESSVTENTSESFRHAFNSSSAVPTDKTTNKNSSEGSTTTTTDRTTKNDSDTTLTKDLTNNATDTYNTTDTETITRVGDLSVRAIQDTIQLDIDLWKKNVFFNIVFEDILSALCLPIWEANE